MTYNLDEVRKLREEQNISFFEARRIWKKAEITRLLDEADTCFTTRRAIRNVVAVLRLMNE
jgi:hypothetical protein